MSEKETETAACLDFVAFDHITRSSSAICAAGQQQQRQQRQPAYPDIPALAAAILCLGAAKLPAGNQQGAKQPFRQQDTFVAHAARRRAAREREDAVLARRAAVAAEAAQAAEQQAKQQQKLAEAEAKANAPKRAAEAKAAAEAQRILEAKVMKIKLSAAHVILVEKAAT